MVKHNSDQIKKLFTNTKTIAVVGLSDNPNRISYQVSRVMQSAGFKIIPVNPNIESALDEPAYATLYDIPESIEIVNVFRKSIFLKDIARATYNIGCPVLWAQQGVIDEELNCLYNDKLIVIMDTCIKLAYQQIGINRHN
ncbi:Predicted CoA-binding protein [Amphibacillus marinus]|uniref:Predicted CoA-binding protein n=1 Tax=Amphibacillus marinus TaxID=872970 RepID=A0A1H8GWH2_9BACI|nr:CoA-binding protein [Amphibacillus marinus]SEN48316.1 Predicted CoA-binding protein [Amphibacillus marinus]